MAWKAAAAVSVQMIACDFGLDDERREWRGRMRSAQCGRNL